MQSGALRDLRKITHIHTVLDNIERCVILLTAQARSGEEFSSLV